MPYSLPCQLQQLSLKLAGTQVETVATTLALAEQNHGEELKRVCLEFVSRHLQQVMASEGYQHMVTLMPPAPGKPSSPCTDPFAAHDSIILVLRSSDLVKASYMRSLNMWE